MHKGRIQATTQQPDDITEERQTTGTAILGNDLLAKRPQYYARQLKTLQPPGKSHDGDTKHKAANYITQGGEEATKNEPDEVTD